MLKIYDKIKLLDIEVKQIENWKFPIEATHIRVFLPSDSQNEIIMQKKGFFLCDRTLKVSVPLLKYKSIDKINHLSIVQTYENKEDILKIALSSFNDDRRFFVTPDCNKNVADMIIKELVEQLGPTLVCLFRNKVIGFCSLVQTSESSLFANLVAVEEKYRMTGAAISLYNSACMFAKNQGFKKLEGKISSKNTDVMNIYASLGGSFYDPQDIFIREMS